MRRFTAMLLHAVLIAMLIFGCAGAGQQGYQKTENTGRQADTYPYLVKTPSATWYMAKADVELLGEDAFYEGLYAGDAAPHPSVSGTQPFASAFSS